MTKTNDPILKCSNLVYGMILRYSKSGMILGLKVKGQGHRVTKFLGHFFMPKKCHVKVYQPVKLEVGNVICSKDIEWC